VAPGHQVRRRGADRLAPRLDLLRPLRARPLAPDVPAQPGLRPSAQRFRAHRARFPVAAITVAAAHRSLGGLPLPPPIGELARGSPRLLTGRRNGVPRTGAPGLPMLPAPPSRAARTPPPAVGGPMAATAHVAPMANARRVRAVALGNTAPHRCHPAFVVLVAQQGADSRGPGSPRGRFMVIHQELLQETLWWIPTTPSRVEAKSWNGILAGGNAPRRLRCRRIIRRVRWALGSNRC
jgi:hypothetical protein